MDAFRRTRYAVTLLILFMALFVSAETAFIQNAEAATITLSASAAIPGTLITVTIPAGVLSASDTSCSISGSPTFTVPSVGTFNLVSNPSSCSLSGGAGTLTFTVAQYAPAGTYTITVTGSPNSDSAQAPFTVTGFTLTLTPTSGAVGTAVSFMITNVPSYDTSCSVSSQPSGVVTLAACSVSAGTGSGTFVVGNVAAGNYVIEVTACTGNTGCPPSGGDFAQAVFNVTAGKVEPTITFTPDQALPGAIISVTLSNFSPSDTSCTLTSLTVQFPSSCTLSGGSGTMTFQVRWYTSEGIQTITATGNVAGDTAIAAFTVLSMNLVLNPNSGETGTNVKLSMTNVPTYDTSCSISSISTPNPITLPGCAVSSGVGNGTFIVGNVPLGDYVIEVTACAGNNGCAPSSGDWVQQVFNVTSGPFIQLSGKTGGFASVGQVASGPVGLHVSISGSDFLTGDALNSATCTVSSPSTSSVLLGKACSFFVSPSGFVNVTGSFVVGNVAEGQYVIQVSGSAGDSAQAVFNVTAGAFIQLGANGVFVSVGQVASGPTGTHVDIEGSQFLPGDALNSATCTVSSPTSGSAMVGNACSFFKTTGGFVNVTGSFVVGKVAEGQYVIQVSGSAGDSAQAVFNVTAGAFIQLGVNGNHVSIGQVASGPIGTDVNIEGSQFLPNDALSGGTCSVSSPTNGAIISTGVTAVCSFFKATSGFVNVTGSFEVGNVPEGQYAITVSGSAGDSAQAVFNVTAGAFIQLGVNGNFASIGQVASGPIGTHVSISGSQFLANDAFNSATCSIGSPSNGAVISNGGCSFFKSTTAPFNGFVNATGSFVVGNVPEGQYVIRVSGSAGDSAEAIVNVTAGAFIQLGVNGNFASIGQAASGPIGTHVSIEGSQFLADDAFNSATCSIGSPSNGAIILNGACSFFKTSTGLVNATGSFVVGNVQEGQYVIRVSGSAGDSAEAIFNVTAGAFIQLGISNGGFVSPGQTAKGPTGTSVSISGSQFLPGDAFNSASCSLSSPTSGTIIQGGACSFFKTSTGLVNATGSFIVGNVHAGQYVIQVSGSAGDSAQAIFNVTSGPFIQLIVGTIHYSVGQVASGPLGTSVGIEGSFFTATATTCSISSPTSSAIISGAGCSIFIPSTGGFVGFANVTGSFIVGNVLPGQYVIQVTDNTGSFAQAIFNVTLGAQISLSPATVKEPGYNVIVNGTGFLPTDTGCVISSPGTNAVEGGTAGCSVRAGTGVISGSFLVGNVLPGQYVIQVTGNQGDFATAVLTVPAGPTLSLSPGTGMTGTTILVNGTSFLATDQSCSISSISTPNPILSAACAITVGFGPTGGNPHGSLVIGGVSPGEYVIEVTGCAGNNGCAPSAGDFAQAVLNVTQGAPTLTLSPSSAAEESTVTFVGTGLNPSDTGCSLQAFDGAVTTPDNTLITSSTCSVISPGIAQGTFIVSAYATHDISWLLQVKGTPINDVTPTEPFTVTPDLAVTPTSGTINTVFTFTGSGFDSSGTCTAVTVPALLVLPAGATAEGYPPTCSLDGTTGQVSGSVIVPAGTASGTYGLMVTDTGGTATATAEFTVGTPSALVVLNPASVDQDQPVGVAGTGFNPNDTYCVITSGGTPPWLGTNGVAPNCAISSGYASGSFVVSTTAPGGYYLISIIACYVAPVSSANGPVCPSGDSLDFASNFLGVTLATTVTTYSTTTTTSSTTTSFSSTTTSIATSFSYSSTTVQTTGIYFTTFTHETASTVSGQTTTTMTSTSSTTQTQTTVTVSTTTSFTTVPCGPLPCGFEIQPAVNPAPGIDSVGLLAAILLVIPMLLRRLLG